VNGRTQQRVDDAVRAVRDAVPQGTVRGIAADLGTRAGADRMITALPAVDVLVNNLGVFEAKPFVEITDAEWLTMFETNVLSGVRLARHYFPRMLSAGWGRVIFISSESAVQIPSEMIHYGMTKTAQVAVARGLAELTKGTAVTVNSVLAGPTRSEGVEQFIEQLASAKGTDAAGVEREFFANMRPTSLLKRFEDPAEIATVVAFLASPKASGINGAAVRAEGGVLRAAL
jgi:NAD(P)-dependent dehydrogenase (short-subunit alcohol dehydrogenase family)